jgi:hypothetical protein
LELTLPESGAYIRTTLARKNRQDVTTVPQPQSLPILRRRPELYTLHEEFEHLRTPNLPPPKDGNSVKRTTGQWSTYRTRFLIKAMQLEEPLSFVDCLGREHSGEAGDYLVQSSDGAWRITPREIFEDVYVPIDGPESWDPTAVPNSPSLPSSLMAAAQRLNLRVTSALSISPSESQGVGMSSQGATAPPSTTLWRRI